MLVGLVMELEAQRREEAVTSRLRERRLRQAAMAARAARPAAGVRAGSAAGIRGWVVGLLGALTGTHTPPGAASSDCATC